MEPFKSPGGHVVGEITGGSHESTHASPVLTVLIPVVLVAFFFSRSLLFNMAVSCLARSDALSR
jgi:hypothetical protein